MRWRVLGTQAMPHVRASYRDGQWKGFHEYRLQPALARVYEFRGMGFGGLHPVILPGPSFAPGDAPAARGLVTQRPGPHTRRL